MVDCGRTMTLRRKGLTGGGYEYEYKGVTSLWRVPIRTMKRLDAEGRLHFTQTRWHTTQTVLGRTEGQAGTRHCGRIFPLSTRRPKSG